MRATIIIALTGLLHAAGSAAATAPAFDNRGIKCWPQPEAGPETDQPEAANEPIEITSGDADISASGDATFNGPIEIRRGRQFLGTTTARYDSKTNTFTADGNVSYRDPESRVEGESAIYNTETGRFNFSAAKFELQGIPARGSASSLEVLETGELEFNNVQYTSCPVGNDDWMLRARKIEIDMDTGMGTARSARLAFKGVPFLYVPYFSYPVTDTRKSGLLFPKIGSSDKRGFEFTQPIYWNIAPNYDATIVPRLMSDRGFQYGSEFRFLTPNNDGTLWGDYLSNDKETDTDRWQYDVETQSSLPAGWRATIRAQGVSDDDYFEDLSSNQGDTSMTNLSQNLKFEYFNPNWSIYLLAQDFQTIDANIDADEEPYAQLPQFVANGNWQDGWLGLDYSLETEAAYFYREDSLNGARTHLRPGITLPIESHGLYFIPEVALDYATYKLTDLPAGTTEDNPDRTAPITSIDTGAIFDRLTGKQNQWLMTLEPRAKYTYIPFRDQSDIPVFDTIQPDFNLVQLFRDNRYTGYDRLGDTSQLSWGLTSRVLRADNGRELLTATVGQTLFFDNGDVTLPGEAPSDASSSDYIAELGVNVWGNWNLDMSIQYDSDNHKTERSSVQLRYKPGDFKAVNLAYRYVDGSLEQADISLAWPLSQSWNFIGRYNYSMLDSEVLDTYAGVEYESCCWGISLLGRQSITRSTGDTDSAISLQFRLKGFSNLGSESSENLQRNILGIRD